MRVKTTVIVGRKLRELPKAKGRLQNIVKSKLAVKVITQIKEKAKSQTEQARSERARQKNITEQRQKNIGIANQIKALKKLTPTSVLSQSNNIYKSTLTQITPQKSPTLNPSQSPKKSTQRLQTVAEKLAERKRQIQAEQKRIRQELDLQRQQKQASRVKVSAALQARQTSYAKKRQAFLKRQAGIQKAITIRSMRLGEGGVVSSNVASVNYDEMNAKLYVAFLNGSEYEYDLSGVSDGVRLAINVWSGQASCKTKGVSQYNGRKWWVGKNPSVGAAVWRYLRNSSIPYKKVSVNVAQYQQNAPNWPYPSKRGNPGFPVNMP